MNEEGIVREVFTKLLDVKRAKGRPKTRWKDCVSQIVRAIGHGLLQIEMNGRTF